jgi:hypothetical protein
MSDVIIFKIIIKEVFKKRKRNSPLENKVVFKKLSLE